MEEKKIDKSFGFRRFTRIFLPFFLLALCLGVYSIFEIQFPKGQDNQNIIPTATADEFFTAAPTNGANTLEEPIIQGTSPDDAVNGSQGGVEATPQITPRGQTITISILGPPTNSSFSKDTPVSIYWNWPDANLNEGYRFSVYIIDDFEERIVGTANEPALGSHGFQINFLPDDLNITPGTYQLEIRLESDSSDTVIAKSDLQNLELE